MDYSDLTIVLPTLNEAGTMGKLLGYITTHYKGARVIVVDDGSSDGTKEIVDGYASSYRRIRFLDRKAKGLEKGLTASIIDGVLASRTKFVIVMDADLQHPPQKIKEVKERLDNGYNIVVASRADVTEWSLYRKIISKSLMVFGYVVLFAGARATCDDIFSGYFGVESELFRRTVAMHRKRFVMEGYKVLFDFLKCTGRGGIKISSVPYVFRTRQGGISKAGMKQGIALFRSFFS